MSQIDDGDGGKEDGVETEQSDYFSGVLINRREKTRTHGKHVQLRGELSSLHFSRVVHQKGDMETSDVAIGLNCLRPVSQRRVTRLDSQRQSLSIT